MLESLNLHLSGNLDIDISHQTVLTVVNDCPRLTKVVLTATKHLQLPWAQIREVTLV